MDAPYEKRLENVQKQLRDANADACVLYPGPNLYYVSGFFGEPRDRHALLVIPADGDPTFITPEKSVDQIAVSSRINNRVVVKNNTGASVARGLQRRLDEHQTNLLLDDQLPYGIVHSLVEQLPDREFGSVGPILSELRLHKDSAEISALERSAAVADEVSEAIRAFGVEAVGMTEAELADEIRGRLHRKGGTRLSFDIVVASGSNADSPFYRHGEREIRAGEPVVLDFGAYVDEYASDQTRTVVFDGDPPEQFRSAYDAVIDALDAGIDAIEPDEPLSIVDRTVRDVIADHGFADQIRHDAGHGIGLEAHEAPSVSSDAELRLESGLTFSVEPGVYFDGEFGVRVEDIVAVTEDGGKRLNSSPRTWKPL